ncbi:fumarylacetoacetate hydrolase family protein [Marisediminicola senii]|uniref:fumarylacetoacetate hydrolase family protein n=1 Tax=Marisediminicola senii TaxID=2711233 RepID=UPI0013EC4D16|nr:fumarylacetoacetate hydrolase family protein [Marisediminicola senii]
MTDDLAAPAAPAAADTHGAPGIPDPVEPTTLPIAGSDRSWPVRRVFCVGRNYADHAREMGNDPDREPPFFFTKPADAVVHASGSIPYPPLTTDFHYAVELVIAIGRGGADIEVDAAAGHIFGYGAGIDLPRRDLQREAKDRGGPWDWAKAFDLSAPVSAIHPLPTILDSGRIWLSVNGELRQDGDLAAMIWPVADIVAAASRAVSLQPGDLIFTGTPAGVGPLQPGDVVTGGVEGVDEFTVTITGRA